MGVHTELVGNTLLSGRMDHGLMHRWQVLLYDSGTDGVLAKRTGRSFSLKRATEDYGKAFADLEKRGVALEHITNGLRAMRQAQA